MFYYAWYNIPAMDPAEVDLEELLLEVDLLLKEIDSQAIRDISKRWFDSLFDENHNCGRWYVALRLAKQIQDSSGVFVGDLLILAWERLLRNACL